MSQMKQLQSWWQSLQKREQQLVLGAGVTLAIAAFIGCCGLRYI